MTISRSSKKADRPERALAVLRAAVADGEIGPDPFRVFVEARVWEHALQPDSSTQPPVF